LHLVVVDADHRFARDRVGSEQEVGELTFEVLVGQERGRRPGWDARASRAPERRRGDPESDPQVGRGGSPPFKRFERGSRHPPDRGGRHIESTEDLQDRLEIARADIQDHSLLGLGDPDLPGSETLLPERDTGEVDPGAKPPRVDEFARGRRDPAAAQILETLDQAPVEGLDTGVDQRLLHDGVAKLDGATGFRFAPVGEFLGGEGDAADPVATRQTPDQDQVVADRMRPVGT